MRLSRVPDEIADTMQTNGVELDDIIYDKSALRIREVGGAFVEVGAFSSALGDECGKCKITYENCLLTFVRLSVVPSL